MWIAGEFESSEEEFYELLKNDEKILDMVLKDRKEISNTFDRRFKQVQGVAEIANSPGKRIERISSSVDELAKFMRE